jgi:hypothetical protein
MATLIPTPTLVIHGISDELREILDITLQEWKPALLPIQRDNIIHHIQYCVINYLDTKGGYMNGYHYKSIANHIQLLLVIAMNLHLAPRDGFLFVEALLCFDALQAIIDR